MTAGGDDELPALAVDATYAWYRSEEDLGQIVTSRKLVIERRHRHVVD